MHDNNLKAELNKLGKSMAARKRGQAAAGEVTQGQAASYEHGEDAAIWTSWRPRHSSGCPATNGCGTFSMTSQRRPQSSVVTDTCQRCMPRRGPGASIAQQCWQQFFMRASGHALSPKAPAKVNGLTGRALSLGQSHTKRW